MRLSGAKLICEITLMSVEGWIARGTAERKWSPVTSRLKLRYMVLFVKWLQKRGLIDGDPLAGICFPRVPKRVPVHLTLEKAETLLRYVRNMRLRSRYETVRAYAIIATFAFTGIRKSELRKLEICDVDLESRVLCVRQGKGGKDRQIPIPPQLGEILRRYFEARSKSKQVGSPYFFTSLSGHGMLAEKVLSRAIERIRSGSKIYFAPHMLRHTFATLMLEGGCDLFSLSKMMGHGDIKTTTVYLSATIDHLREQARKHPLLSTTRV